MSLTPADPIAGVAVLILRGLLLWVLVPVGFIAWILMSPWLLHKGVGPAKFLGWLDSNFTVLLERSLLRPWFPKPTHSWTSVKDMSKVKHRIGAGDLF